MNEITLKLNSRLSFDGIKRILHFGTVLVYGWVFGGIAAIVATHFAHSSPKTKSQILNKWQNV